MMQSPIKKPRLSDRERALLNDDPYLPPNDEPVILIPLAKPERPPRVGVEDLVFWMIGAVGVVLFVAAMVLLFVVKKKVAP